MGDATWTSLFPDRLHQAHPFPCFNVRDLHTVDDGVAAHLPRLLADPAGWDVLVAHTLGVDHAGHAHGVGSPHMAAKLHQTDALILDWLGAMAARAAPGAEFHHTLLLVLGDHGAGRLGARVRQACAGRGVCVLWNSARRETTTPPRSSLAPLHPVPRNPASSL